MVGAIKRAGHVAHELGALMSSPGQFEKIKVVFFVDELPRAVEEAVISDLVGLYLALLLYW